MVERTAILRALDANDFDVVDMHKIFRAHSDPLSLFPMRVPGHYNAEGSALVAQTVASGICTTVADRKSDESPSALLQACEAFSRAPLTQ